MQPNVVNAYNAIEFPFLPYRYSVVKNDGINPSKLNPQFRDSYCLKRSAAGILGYIIHSYVPFEQLLHIIYDQHRFGYLLDRKALDNVPALSVLENIMNEVISHQQRLDSMQISSHEAFLLFHHFPAKVARIASWNFQSVRCLRLLCINDFYDIIDGKCVPEAGLLSHIHLEEIRDIPDSALVMILGAFNGV